jgi:DNA ligase D-like protein (predicted 3'-phosphoesterase)
MKKYRCISAGIAVLTLIGGSVYMVKKSNRLASYRAKRDFTTTVEPSGKKTRARETKGPIFVVQQHAARSMHYDLRLEIDGVLASWAVPKGPSTNPADKRLAVLTEDHPMAYGKFEGVIPEGNYGAGEVIVWDRGTYENVKEPKTMRECFDEGRIEITLQGKKLMGDYALVRMHDGEKNWLLIKMKDDYADARTNIVKSEPESVISGKTIKDLQEKKE